MGMWIGRNRKARVTYGFDEIALVPGRITINPNEVDITFRLARKGMEPLVLKIPILASAMDGVVDVPFAIAMGRLGGLAVLNLDGVQTRYEDPAPVIRRIAEADLVEARIREIKAAGVACAVSTVPAGAQERARLVEAAGADVYVVQGTVLTARHRSRSYHQLSFQE